MGELTRLRLSVAVCFLAAFAIWSPVTHARTDDDVVILKNGDRMTGEIKGLRSGELRFKASYMAEAVRIDWTKVARLESKGTFLTQLVDGQLFTESLSLAPSGTASADNFVIGSEKSAFRTKQGEVLRITPVESGVWQQLDGSIDLGASFTSGTDQYQAELGATATYIRRKDSFTGSLNSAFSGQTQGSSSNRHQLSFDYRRQLTTKWYAGGLLDLLHSDQQSLVLRTTAGGLIGRNLKQTDHTRFSVFGGLAATRERYSEDVGQPRSTNLDALAGVDFRTFRFKTLDVNSRFLFYPSLTASGRMRMQFRSNLRVELVKDLYVGFNLYENFDSRPPVNANKNDLGVSTSLGWKF